MAIKNPDGGLTAEGRAHYKKKEGANLKPGVKSYSTASRADKMRWCNWAIRFYGRETYPPFKKPNGDPTRFALMARAWGEPVPKTAAAARAIAAKARRRLTQLKGD